MAVIYLRHPIHGAKVASLDIEAEYDKQRGWEEFDPTASVDDSTEPEPEVVNSLSEPRRRGRPRKE